MFHQGDSSLPGLNSASHTHLDKRADCLEFLETLVYFERTCKVVFFICLGTIFTFAEAIFYRFDYMVCHSLNAQIGRAKKNTLDTE